MPDNTSRSRTVSMATLSGPRAAVGFQGWSGSLQARTGHAAGSTEAAQASSESQADLNRGTEQAPGTETWRNAEQTPPFHAVLTWGPADPPAPWHPNP